MQDPENYSYSSVEDIDPEPRTGVGLSWAREFVIGMLLVIGVLGWGGWQWWHEQRVQDNYRLAQQAAARQDWDAALGYYATASGYKDADTRGAEAAKLVAERNRQYDIAVSASKTGDWEAYLRATQAVSRVQPDYKDIKTRNATLEAQVYKAAVYGSIARRTGIDHPGLYYRDLNCWVWLKGSDQFSSVLGAESGTKGYAVYDVPGPGWTPTRQSPSQDNSYRPTSSSHDLDGRRLVLASLDGSKINYTPLAFDPAEY